MMVVKQGTLIIDNGKVGVIISVYKVGSTANGDQYASVHWEESYHIFYSDGSFSCGLIIQLRFCGSIMHLNSRAIIA